MKAKIRLIFLTFLVTFLAVAGSGYLFVSLNWEKMKRFEILRKDAEKYAKNISAFQLEYAKNHGLEPIKTLFLV